MGESRTNRWALALADAFDKAALGSGVLLLGWFLYQNEWLMAANTLALLVFVYGGLKWLFAYYRPEKEESA